MASESPPQGSPNSDVALRLRRFYMAVATYGMASVLFALMVVQDYLAERFFALVLGLVVAVNLVFYYLLRSGRSRYFRDPSLTVAQIVAATLVLMVVLYFVDAARGALLLLYPVTFVFGIFRLSTAQFLGLNLFALVAYGALIALLYATRPESIDLKLELLQWVALAFVLPSFALIGGYISRMRNRLWERNEDLRDALLRIQEMAIHDELTGAYNRRWMLEQIEREKDRVDRLGGTFTVALLDLDFFKAVNDTHGHLAGDRVLKEFVLVCQARLRAMDNFARYGGEEFMAMLPRTGLDEAQVIAERLREAVQTTDLSAIADGLRLTVSVGIAEYRKGEAVERLIERADAALYSAKAAGRNQVLAHSG